MAEFILVTTPEQANQVDLLAREIWNQHYVTIVGQAQVDYMLRTYQNAQAIWSSIQTNQCRYYLIVQGGLAVGYLGIQPQGQLLFLSKLYLLQGMRGQGIAKQAVEFLWQLCQTEGLTCIRLTCGTENTTALKAYERLGFRMIGTKRGDIGNGYIMDDTILELNVPQIKKEV